MFARIPPMMMTLDTPGALSSGAVGAFTFGDATASDRTVQGVASGAFQGVGDVSGAGPLAFVARTVALLAGLTSLVLILALGSLAPGGGLFPLQFGVAYLVGVVEAIAILGVALALLTRPVETVAVARHCVEFGSGFRVLAFFAPFQHTGGFSTPRRCWEHGGF